MGNVPKPKASNPPTKTGPVGAPPTQTSVPEKSFTTEPPPLKPPPLGVPVPRSRTQDQQPQQIQSQVDFPALLSILMELLQMAEVFDKQKKYQKQITEIRNGFTEELIVNLKNSSLDQTAAALLSECLTIIKQQKYTEATEFYKKFDTSIYDSIGNKGMVALRRLIKLLELLQTNT
jgi:hypothetical protein